MSKVIFYLMGFTFVINVVAVVLNAAVAVAGHPTNGLFIPLNLYFAWSSLRSMREAVLEDVEFCDCDDNPEEN